jgi:predicted acetyltransferase
MSQNKEKLKLVVPDSSLLAAFEDYCKAFKNADLPERMIRGYDSSESPAETIVQYRLHREGINLPDGYVPYSPFWLVRDDKTILGALSIRHRLNDHLRHIGGHIGFVIRPEAWGHGYATQMLALGLEEASQMGHDRVLLTCAKENLASARVIEKNGGRLTGESRQELDGQVTMIQYYWIDLTER